MSNKHEKGISDIVAWTLANKSGGGSGGDYATKKDLQLVEENKADRSIYLLDNSVVTQADARDILAYADQYTGIIEFISTSESKVSAIGYIISNSDGTCLVTITNDGTSTQWSKDGFSKYNVEARNLINEPVVDTDNLTVDVVGNPPVLYMLRNAKNKPEGSGEDGSMMVIPHSISKQIFIYTDMDTAKIWTKVVTGTDGQHSFGTWNVLGGVGKAVLNNSEIFNDYIENKATGTYSHAEGYYTTASGDYGSHAEGHLTTASGAGSHAEGYRTNASGKASHSEGWHTTASGNLGSHAEGEGTTASSETQHVQGKYNIDDPTNKYVHIVGNGKNDSSTHWIPVYSNAHTLDWKGNSWYQGNVLVGGTDMDAPMSVLAPDHIIIKASDSEDRFKITVDKTGAIKAEKIV